MNAYAPFARPLYVMLKPVGSRCNMACSYCYYSEKEKLYAGQRPLLTEQDLELFTQQYIEAQTMQQVLFTWHGGEPLMRPVSFYRKAMDLQRKYADGRIIDNCIQTNGSLLNDEWCRFFKENHWLVGLSIDGPQASHDAYRRFTNGSPTFAQVMRGIDCLNKHQVEWNAMAVVNSRNVDDPLGFYRFFKELDCHYIQFTPIVERLSPKPDGRHLAAPDELGECNFSDESASAHLSLTPESITPEQWGSFLCAIFDEWIKEDVGRFFVQIFDATLANWVGEEPGLCSLSSHCGHAAVMEFNGDVYSCDHFVFPQYRLGNIHENTLIEMLYGSQQQAFASKKTQNLPEDCQQCEFLFACHGECPKNRFARAAGGVSGLNYLCPGYRQFFSHVAPYMDFMAAELRANRAPANVMKALASFR